MGNTLEIQFRLAERGGFEPPIGLHLCRISSAVHSTTLPPLRITGWRSVSAVGFIAADSGAGKGLFEEYVTVLLLSP